VETLRKERDDSVPIMIDANQQWDRVTAMRFGRAVEPLNAYDAEGHAHDIIQPDTPRLGRVTPFLKLTDMPYDNGLPLDLHFVIEIHIHLTACYLSESWIEHIEWLEPLFNETVSYGRCVGLGLPYLG
jgi:L-alanine-DL-glutamate epimerase-like enolase superfamily enzyme